MTITLPEIIVQVLIRKNLIKKLQRIAFYGIIVNFHANVCVSSGLGSEAIICKLHVDYTK